MQREKLFQSEKLSGWAKQTPRSFKSTDKQKCFRELCSRVVIPLSSVDGWTGRCNLKLNWLDAKLIQEGIVVGVGVVPLEIVPCWKSLLGQLIITLHSTSDRGQGSIIKAITSYLFPPHSPQHTLKTETWQKCK